MRFEFIEGGDLAERISHGNWPTASNAEALLEGLLRGVAALHEAKTIHRDIKPGNIALRDGDWSRPVLLDLGLAKQMDGSTITAYPGLIGTYFYMAPEQLRGERAKKAADLWAVGVTVRELIDQRHPFYSADNPPHSIDEALQAIANGPTPLPDDIEGGAREVLERLTSTREYDRGSTGSNLRRLQETRRAI
jgi:serine/threonine protein kinase